jgi:ATP-binding cassette subfamily B protein
MVQRVTSRDVRFTVEPGQLVALVGPSGAGKTAATYLLPRLNDPTEGRILIDGHDIEEVTLKSLSDNIGMVTQETYLFRDSIRASLVFARPDASEGNLITAAKATNIHDLVTSLPDRCDTVLERGRRLSGGVSCLETRERPAGLTLLAASALWAGAQGFEPRLADA